MSSKKENEFCEWYVKHIPCGFPFYATECGHMRISRATGIDIYCNACGKKIKIVDVTKVGENNEQ